MLQEVPPSSTNPRETLLASVARIKDTLVAQIATEEADARLSRASADALYDTGILHMKLPRVLGGHEADLVTQFEVLEAVASINPAAGWCAMVGATSLAMPGAFLPERGIERMFAHGRIPRGAIVIMPTGEGTPVAGGYRLTGRWAFASGIHHAEWVSANALVRDAPDAPPRLHMFTFPAANATIHNNWQVLGLRGTGSCDIAVDDIFIPADCAWDVERQSPRRGGALYRLGIPAFVAYEHAAFATGVARHALDALSRIANTKKRGYAADAKSLGDRESLQRFLGHGDMKLRAARALAIELNTQAMTTIESDPALPATLALELRASAVYCTEVATEIVGQAFRFAGAASIFEGSDLQRCLRDINVAGQHLLVSDKTYELLGQSRLGVANISPMG